MSIKSLPSDWVEITIEEFKYIIENVMEVVTGVIPTYYKDHEGCTFKLVNSFKNKVCSRVFFIKVSLAEYEKIHKRLERLGSGGSFE